MILYKLRLTLLIIIICAVCSRIAYGDAGKMPVLRILNWSDYILIDDHIAKSEPIVKRSPVLTDFEKQYNCRIEYFEYDSTIEMYKSIQNLPGFYDLLIISHGEIPDMVKAGLLLKLTKTKIPRAAFISKDYLGLQQDPHNDYSIPYLSGTTGIAYNQEMVGAAKVNWDYYFHPDQKLIGKIAILDDPVVMVPMALMSLGYDPKSSDPLEIKKAGRLIYDLVKNGFVGLRSPDVSLIKQKLLNGDIAIASLYSGDALSIYQKSNKRINYIIPEEGGEYYVDSFVISKSTQNAELAHQFINFVLTPEIHAASAIYLKYSCPNQKSYVYMEKNAPDIVNHPAIYPPAAIFAKLKYFDNKNPEIKILWDKIFKGPAQ